MKTNPETIGMWVLTLTICTCLLAGAAWIVVLSYIGMKVLL